MAKIKNGCEQRIIARDEIKRLKQKVYNEQKVVDELNEQIFEQLEKDAELQKAGYCLKDKEKIVKNALTGQIIKVELLHDKNCLENGGNGTNENIDLNVEKPQLQKNKIIYLLEEKLKNAGYLINSFEELFDTLNCAEIVTRHKTAEKILIEKMINIGGI